MSTDVPRFELRGASCSRLGPTLTVVFLDEMSPAAEAICYNAINVDRAEGSPWAEEGVTNLFLRIRKVLLGLVEARLIEVDQFQPRGLPRAWVRGSGAL